MEIDIRPWLFPLYPYVLAPTMGVSIVYFIWIWKTQLDPQMRMLVFGIFLLSTGLFLENTYGFYFRLIGVRADGLTNLLMLMFIKFLIASGSYLHLHVFLSIRFRRFFSRGRWLALGGLGLLMYPVMVIFFYLYL